MGGLLVFIGVFFLRGSTQDHGFSFEEHFLDGPIVYLFCTMDMATMIYLLKHHSPTSAHGCSLRGELQIRRFIFQEVYNILGNPVVVFR